MEDLKVFSNVTQYIKIEMGAETFGIDISFIDNIIRIGTAGSIQEDIKIGDIVIGMGTSTDSAYFNQFDLPGTYAATANYHLLETCKKTADEISNAAFTLI